MRKCHALAAVLALGSLVALPACSMNSGHSGGGMAMARPSQVSPSMVRQVQADLQQQGIYKGNVDGMWGPETQNAVARFQQAHGMPASGELNSPTLAALNLPADGAMAPATAMAPAPVTAPAPMTAPPATVSGATTPSTPTAPAATSSTQ